MEILGSQGQAPGALLPHPEDPALFSQGAVWQGQVSSSHWGDRAGMGHEGIMKTMAGVWVENGLLCKPIREAEP